MPNVSQDKKAREQEIRNAARSRLEATKGKFPRSDPKKAAKPKTGTNDAWKPEPPGKAYYEFLAKKQLWDKQAAEFYEKLDKDMPGWDKGWGSKTKPKKK